MNITKVSPAITVIESAHPTHRSRNICYVWIHLLTIFKHCGHMKYTVTTGTIRIYQMPVTRNVKFTKLKTTNSSSKTVRWSRLCFVADTNRLSTSVIRFGANISKAYISCLALWTIISRSTTSTNCGAIIGWLKATQCSNRCIRNNSRYKNRAEETESNQKHFVRYENNVILRVYFIVRTNVRRRTKQSRAFSFM